MLVSGRIGRAASQAGEQGQLGEAALFWSFFSGLGCEVFFLLLPLAMSVIRTLAALRGQRTGLQCRGRVWSLQGTPHGTGMMAEGRHRTAAGMRTADDYDFIF